ncbi:MAG: DUF2244 domain-containing protein [Hyphomonas sp.]|uniref:DUF2244 domain-containing protein n=1 Tax=Hyphomonas sp. TaxID=87 RepID=UPI0018376E91|nr:DUF2244 domain-containing protein [Hyphomonas sp.]MBA3067159.1 DUF2244 domain-containing protein [Hyphomonas sp.]MBU3920098.1 DUF2244 domain-containing protein [Alphaproteobacteria bacterium]MBU4061231.1 DUF2244 domain-containing protein [Alphaproteobacteria bacterium]MBU4165143.1 DUF2244 domain-containing protein [Alphaproteobacteria bacterium]
MIQPAETIYLDAVLTPNRSLSERGFAIGMAIVAVVFFLTGLLFWSMGAAPILGFFGLDMAAIWLAFRLSFRQQREQTRVVVTARSVRMHHTDARGRKKEAEVPSAFARIELAEPVTHASWLRIEHGRTAFVIGRFLTPDERKSFAVALRKALLAARAERLPA